MTVNPENIYDDGIGAVELIEVAGDDAAVVRAARVSLGRDRTPFDAERDGKLIAYLLAHRHETPFEHTMLTFRVAAPLFVVQEMLRHRIGISINQTSARYVEMRPEFYVPAQFRQQSASNRQASDGALPEAENNAARLIYASACQKAYAAYEELLALGAPREQARGALPHCTYTSLYYTLNLRSLFHFLGLRLPSGAQWEIRQIAQAFVALAEPHFPVTFAAWRAL